MIPRATAAAALVALALACRADAPPPAEPAPAATEAAAPGEVKLAALPTFLKTAPVVVTLEAAGASATGRVTFDEERVSRVASPVSGRVLELLAKPGDTVARGQALLAIASPDVQAASAELVSAEVDLRAAGKNLERARRLAADQAIPRKDLLAAESDALKARAALRRAGTRVSVLGLATGDRAGAGSRYLLRAPIAGTVVERPAGIGMEVRADTGTPLVTVADLSRLWVLVDVYERDLALVARGQRAEVRVPAWPGQVFPGQVTHVGELVDPATRTVKIRVEVANPGLRLKPEMFARVALAGGQAKGSALTVPSEAVLSDGEASAVVVALGDGRFTKRVVEVGPEAEGRTRVVAGLREGEQVVVAGALFVKAEIEGR